MITKDTVAPLTACLQKKLWICASKSTLTHQQAKHHEWMTIPELRSDLDSLPESALIDKLSLLDFMLGRSLGLWRFDVPLLHNDERVAMREKTSTR
jgi:hypothetical protein